MKRLVLNKVLRVVVEVAFLQWRLCHKGVIMVATKWGSRKIADICIVRTWYVFCGAKPMLKNGWGGRIWHIAAMCRDGEGKMAGVCADHRGGWRRAGVSEGVARHSRAATVARVQSCSTSLHIKQLRRVG